jgi:hypothetical protein
VNTNSIPSKISPIVCSKVGGVLEDSGECSFHGPKEALNIVTPEGNNGCSIEQNYEGRAIKPYIRKYAESCDSVLAGIGKFHDLIKSRKSFDKAFREPFITYAQ